MSLTPPQTSSFRLSKAQRLRTPKDFQRVYQNKQWGHSKHHSFNVIAERNGLKSLPKLGVTVSKKVSKLAVIRNRIKRQVKEFYRFRQHDLIIDASLVITAKPSCAKISAQQRRESLEILWQKLIKWQSWHKETNQLYVKSD